MMHALAQSLVIATERDEHRGGVAQGIQPHREAGCIAVARGLESLLPQHVGLVTFGCLAGVINSNAFRGSIGTTEKSPGTSVPGLFDVFSGLSPTACCRHYSVGAPVAGTGAGVGIGVVGIMGTTGPGVVMIGVPSIEPQSHGLSV